MSGINKAIILGRVGKDPETRYTAEGKAVTNFSLATSFGKGDAEKTEWHRCTAWEKQAKLVAEYVHKGDQLYIEGELQTRKWQNKDGNDQYTTEIRVFKIEFCGNKGGRSDGDEPAVRHGPAVKTVVVKTAPSVEDMDSDIPF